MLVPIFLVLVFLTTFVMYYMYGLGAPLITEAAPYGILSFEFAWSVDRASLMIEEWGTAASTNAQFLLLVDYLFLALYSTTIGIGCVLVVQNVDLSVRFGIWGNAIAWLQWMAALLDAVENAALFGVLSGSYHWPLVQLAFWTALPKFLLVLTGLGYCLLGIGLVLFEARQAPSSFD